MPAAEQIVSRHDVGRVLLCEHEPDAAGLFANNCFLEFVSQEYGPIEAPSSEFGQRRD